jgi:hypothetical protein
MMCEILQNPKENIQILDGLLSFGAIATQQGSPRVRGLMGSGSTQVGARPNRSWSDIYDLLGTLMGSTTPILWVLWVGGGS